MFEFFFFNSSQLGISNNIRGHEIKTYQTIRSIWERKDGPGWCERNVAWNMIQETVD